MCNLFLLHVINMYMYIYFLKVHLYMYGMEFVLLEISLPIVQNREKPRFFMKKKLTDLIPLGWFWNIFKWLATLCIFFIITAILLLLHKWASGPLGFCWIYLFNVCHWPCHRSHNSCRNAILYSSKFGRYNGQLSFFLYILYKKRFWRSINERTSTL